MNWMHLSELVRLVMNGTSEAKQSFNNIKKNFPQQTFYQSTTSNPKCGCENFHKLLYGKSDVTIESDHKPDNRG